MNTAYIQLVHKFSDKYIPYLRDEDGQRLQKLCAPYEKHEAPADIYERLLLLDERENRGNQSQDYLESVYLEPVNGDDSYGGNVVDLTQDTNQGISGVLLNHT
jgi:hypothetical protein